MSRRAPSNPQRPAARRRPKWPWVLLGLGLLGGTVVYAPTLFGGFLLRHYGADLGLSGDQVGGTLWAPKLGGVVFKQKGVTVKAGEVKINVASVDPQRRAVRVNVAVADADIALQLKDLLGRPGGAGGQPGWTVVLGDVSVQRTRLSLDGSGVNIPDAQLRLSRAPDGSTAFTGQTAEGKLSGQVKVKEMGEPAQNAYVVNFGADARILRPYWTGVEGGRLRGRYLFGPGPVQGDVALTDGLLRVPDAEFITVRQVEGRALHRGNDVRLKLAGRAWDGPVGITGGIFLKYGAENWTATLDATPTVAGLARSLGTAGQGDLKLRVTAGGWSTVRVKGYVGAGEQGQATFAGVPFRRLRAEYTFLNRQGEKAPQTNDIDFSAQTFLAGQQELRGQWAFGRAGTVGWKGDFAGKAVNLTGRISAEDKIALLGQALGGDAKGTYDLRDGALQATLNPDYGAARARVVLRGQADDLRADISAGEAGPLTYSGTARFDRRGLRADLMTSEKGIPGTGTGSTNTGRLSLDLGPQLAGQWQAQNLTLSGARLSGGGRLDLTKTTLSGDVRATVPGIDAPLSGRLQADVGRQQATFTAGAQRLTWQGASVGLRARDLSVLGGVRVTGDVVAGLRGDEPLSATGQLTARGNGYALQADLRGQQAAVRGTAGGLTILARSDLNAPYRTSARVQGSEVSGVLSLDGDSGVRFSLLTRGERASGVIDGPRVDAAGRIDLAALRPLLPAGAGVNDLSGTLDLNLRGLGGGARVAVRAAGVAVSGTLTRQVGPSPIGRLLADLTASLPVGSEQASTRLSGQLYPAVSVSGNASYMGQTLRAQVTGPYDRLRLALSGRTGPLTLNGVGVPAQNLDLSGALTPRPALSGRWGDLRATYDGQRLSAEGTQNLTAAGRAVRVQGEAIWGPSFAGRVRATASAEGYSVALDGPWRNLNVLAQGPEGLQARGTASLPAGTYDLQVLGPVVLPGQARLFINGRVQGQGDQPRGLLTVTDGKGGRGRLRLQGLDDLSLDAENLTVAGQVLSGRLSTAGGSLSGQVRAGPFDLTARGGRVFATGEFGGQKVRLTGRLVLPATLSDLQVTSTGPYLSAQARGNLSDLRGTLTLKEQRLGADAARLVVPVQTFPLRASPLSGRVNVGGLGYAGGRWSGALDAAYSLQTADLRRTGRLRVVGEGATLAALPGGPLRGRVGLLPNIGGEVRTDLAPFLTDLPPDLRGAIQAGQIVVGVGAERASVRLTQTRYLDQPLSLKAQASWKGGVAASGLLQSRGLYLPVQYSAAGLTVSGASLEARLLRPIVPDVSGTARLSLSVPQLDWQRAAGRVRLNVRASGQPVTGTLTLRGGTLDGDLQAGPLRLSARKNQVRAAGRWADHDLSAAGRLVLPGAGQAVHLSGLRVNVSGPYLSAAATGDLERLTGRLDWHGQSFGSGAARLDIPSQGFALVASPLSGRVNVGGLGYAGGRWSGGLDAAYALHTAELRRTGRLRLAGGGQTLAALPSGPLRGRVNVLPSISGEVSTDLTPFAGQLPEVLRKEVRPGQLFAKVSASGADLRLVGAQYQRQPLGLNAALNWRGGFTARGQLTHPGTRLPFEYSGKDLQVTGAVLSGAALRPVLAGASGQARLDLTVPNLEWRGANGQAAVHLTAQGQAARGTVTLRSGQLAADLRSDIGGQPLAVQGLIYPQAKASVRYGDLRGTLTGRAERQLRLQAAGRLQGRDLRLDLSGHALTSGAARLALIAQSGGATLRAQARQSAGEWKAGGSLSVPDLQPFVQRPGRLEATFEGTPERLTVQGNGLGTAVNILAQRGVGNGPDAWKLSGGLSIPDLKPLAQTEGSVAATFSGTANDLRLQASGTAAGIPFTAPARYAAGRLSVGNLWAELPAGQGGGEVRASGQVWPRLDLSGSARLSEGLPGQYAARVAGTFAKPDVRLSGRLTQGVAGLEAAGTRLSARYLGGDWKADLSGAALSGTVRGKLGSGALGGLQNADLRLNTRYRSGDLYLGLRGPLAWNARQGWGGGVRVTGDIPGGPLDAMLDGRGALALAGSLGSGEERAEFVGTLPAALPLKPAGRLRLTRLDLGAFWNRPEELRVTGDASLSGASWAEVGAHFTGQLADRAGELSGALTARYAGGDAALKLTGPRVQGSALLNSGRYDAKLKAASVTLARLLPSDFGVSALKFGGEIAASGTTQRGPERVSLQRVVLRGQHKDAGPFSLYGSAEYDPRTEALRADLQGSLRGGTWQARGALPQGLSVQLQNVATDFAGAASFGTGQLGGEVTLRGDLRDPVVVGRLGGVIRQSGDVFDTRLILSGRARRPNVQARVQASGQASGTLYAQAKALDFTALTKTPVRVYGSLRSGGNLLQADLAGAWPRLRGAATARVDALPEPLSFRGDGTGQFAVQAGRLGGGTLQLSEGEGLIPRLTGRLDLTPLSLVEGAQGQARVTATLGGTLTGPTLSADLVTQGVNIAGAEWHDLRGTLAGKLSDIGSLSGTFTQSGAAAPVATLRGQTLALSGLGLRAAGSEVRASGTATLRGRAELKLTATGAVAGDVQAEYDLGSLRVAGQVAAQGVQAALDLRATPYTGWNGTARVTGGPPGVLTGPLTLKVSGAYRFPLVTGEGGLLGARARVVADARGAQVRLLDGPEATANGLVTLRPDAAGEWRWGGAASLSREELALSVIPTGAVAQPTLALTLRRGEWRASGTASAQAADLALSDGEREGRVTWNGKEVRADLPGLDLTRLGVTGLSGKLSAAGAVGTRTQDGAVQFRVTGLTAPGPLPLLGVTPQGEVSGVLTLRGGRPSVQAQAALNVGTLGLSAQQVPGEGGGQPHWQGALSGTLRQGDGRAEVDVRSGAAGLSGSVNVVALPLTVSGQVLTAGGQVLLQGRTFSANLTAQSELARARVTAEGGIADLVPALSGPLALPETGEGYSARATLDAVELSDFKLAPGLTGKVYGSANLSDGAATFLLASDAVTLGQKAMPLRVEGTRVGESWRLRGFLDHSDFTAGLSGGEVFGQGTLQALPLGAVVGAVTGETPGEGVVTGVARFRFPLADPAAGSASVVAERIRVSAEREEDGKKVTETLTGTGSLDYAARELRRINVQLSGAGRWDLRGQYTRQKVDVTARFENATFTPVLRLIPGLADLDPALRGTVLLSAAGTYDRPRALLRAENLVGEAAGLSLRVPQFSGDLPDSGAFTASGTVQTGGTLGSDGRLSVAGQLTLGKLSGTVATFSGLLAPQALGPLPNTTLTLRQKGEAGWALEGQSRSVSAGRGAGLLSLSGDLTPRPDLTVQASNYNLPISAIYARESSLSGTFRVRDGGDFVRVSGEGDFARLTLGRVDAPANLPGAPGSKPGTSPGETFVSPLPEEYTTFAPTTSAKESEKAAPPFAERLLFDDVLLRASGGIRLQENLVRAELSTSGLTISGTGARPRVRGEIIPQRGSISLRENEFAVTDGKVTFTGEDVYPSFKLTARGTVPLPTTGQQVPIALNVAGDFLTVGRRVGVLNLETQLTCAEETEQCRNRVTGNNYTQEELYALVATGVPDLNNLGSNLAGLGSSALQTALNVFFLGELERTLARGLGVDVIRLTPALGTDGSVNATFTVGSYLTRELFVQYQVDLTGRSLIDATYSTPDGRFTFKVSAPISGLDLQSVRPNFSASYNVNPRLSFTLGVESRAARAASATATAQPESTRLRFGVTYRIGAR